MMIPRSNKTVLYAVFGCLASMLAVLILGGGEAPASRLLLCLHYFICL